MKCAIIYYSLEGNTKLISRIIKDELECDVFSITTKKEINESGLQKYFLGGKQVFMKECPEIETDFVDNGYETIILGTPVWAGSISPAIYSFLNKYSFNDKCVVLYACYKAGQGKVFQAFRKLLKDGNYIIEEKLFNEPKEKNPIMLKKEVSFWIKSLDINQ